ncbi:hypothetical protein MKX01_020656 [Papaver californicum]|nr:hypothetical protein MKX01_020656 [Papaver californicum]
MLETSASCSRPAATKTVDINPSSSSPAVSGKPNVTTCIYETADLGLISLTWYRNIIGRSLQIDFRLDSTSEISTSFNLHIKPFLFWRKNGSKTKFGSDPDPEPKSGFYVSIVVGGDLQNAYTIMKKNPEKKNDQQVLVLRREDVVFGTSNSRLSYSTKARFGGKTRDISIECCSSIDDDDDEENKELCFSIDGHAVFMFRFENDDADEEEEEIIDEKVSGMITCGFGFGLKKRRCYYKTTSYSSSSSSTISSSVSSGSVMEWANTEDSELDPPGFSLLVHAWKKN